MLRAGLTIAALLLSSLASAQQADSNDELAAQATDPTAALMSFQLNDWYTPSFHGLDDSANQVVFRTAIPFSLGSMQHILRVTQPYATSSPSGATGWSTRRSSTWWYSHSPGDAGASASPARYRPAPMA